MTTLEDVAARAGELVMGETKVVPFGGKFYSVVRTGDAWWVHCHDQRSQALGHITVLKACKGWPRSLAEYAPGRRYHPYFGRRMPAGIDTKRKATP